MPSNLSQKPAEKIDNYASLEASHKTELENLQQQLHTLKNSLENKLTDLQEQLGSTKNSLSTKDTEFQTLKNSLLKDIEKLQQQLGSTKISLSEKDTEFQTLKNSLLKDIEKLQQQLDKLQSNDIKRVNDIEKIQSTLSQMSEKNAQYEKRDKKYEMLIETLQKDINELKQQKSGYNHNEVDTYKNQIEAERQRAAVAEEALKQTSFELQEKQKETLKLRQSQRESQSTIQKLKDALRVSENELNSKIAQYDKEIQQYKNLSAAERESTVKIQQLSAEMQKENSDKIQLQDALTKLSTELQEKTEEALIAKKAQDKLQATVKKLEDALKQSQSENGSTKYTNEMKQYKTLYEIEKENTVKTQEDLTRMTTKLQLKTEEILSLKQSHQKWLHEKQKIEK